MYTWRIPVSKWLITMVIVSPLSRVVGPLTNGRTSWLINGGDPNHFLIGMILQVGLIDIILHESFKSNSVAITNE